MIKDLARTFNASSLAEIADAAETYYKLCLNGSWAEKSDPEAAALCDAAIQYQNAAIALRFIIKSQGE